MTIDAFDLNRYKRFIDASLIVRINQIAQPLNGIHVLHVNTTAEGGGVAEILQSLIPTVQKLGIRHSWKVVYLDERACNFIAQLWDLIQGLLGETSSMPSTKEQDYFLQSLSQSFSALGEMKADIYFIHDVQLAPLALLFPRMRPALWFCHVDTAHPYPEAEAYIKQFLEEYKLLVFNSPASIFKGLSQERTQVITPRIDPFRGKNRSLAQSRGMELLTSFDIDTTRPLITQVSRFGKWKNPWQAIDIYRQAKRHIPSVQLALVGAMQAIEDIKAKEVLADLENYAAGDHDIHLLHDAASIRENEVNAFQRFSNVILQRSTREGFGLTVTEAMWKGQPVVGTSATGLRRQIIHGYNGYIADDTETAATYTVELIQNRLLSRKLGKHARTTVKEHFLLPLMIVEYLEVLLTVLSTNQSPLAL